MRRPKGIKTKSKVKISLFDNKDKKEKEVVQLAFEEIGGKTIRGIRNDLPYPFEISKEDLDKIIVSQKIKEPSIALDAGFPDAKPLPGKNIYKNPNAWADVSQKIRQASQILNNPNFSLSKEDIRMWKMYRDYLMHFKNEFKTKGSAPDFNSWSQHMSKLHA